MWRFLVNSMTLLSPFIPFISDHSSTTQAYKGPLATGGAWSEAFLRAEAVVRNLTLEEKVNLTSAVAGPCPSNSGGVWRLGIPGMCFDDGRKLRSNTESLAYADKRIASGPRYTDFVTQWPSAFTAAASFDRELIYERAQRIGEEFRGKGINVALAPVSCATTEVCLSSSLGDRRTTRTIVSDTQPLEAEWPGHSRGGTGKVYLQHISL